EQRPIKVVIKGLPKDTKTSDIHSDLVDLGFTVNRVTQLVGKITNQALPVFLVSLPRNIHNAKIFSINNLSYLTVRVEGYDNKGVTQCYQCNNFNHTADNCHPKPRCLKCGEAHQTSECQIKRVDTMYCTNCNVYGYMANYSKCPLYPKPKKGTTTKTNYTNVINSLVRPNVTFAQATENKQAPSTPTIPQQVTPRVGQVPVINQTQTQANKIQIPQIKTSKNDCMNLISQTLGQTIQALSTVVEQINNINQFKNTQKPTTNSKNKKLKEIYALLGAYMDDDDK
ncbi:PRE_C2HC domain-containing protein, partial [Trichonephila clavipes]